VALNSGKKTTKIIGVISDTHGLVRPEALRALKGVDLLIHAGDIGSPEVIESLKSIASVVAIRGNIDTGEWAYDFPDTEVVEFGGVLIYVLHDIMQLDLDPGKAGFCAVISGHSHCPLITKRNGVLFLNPGSAGPRRFKLPVSIARLRVKGASVDAKVVELNV
jgi:putative phosphoesterase